ncbi:hypothetical protein VNI00_018794 [Paramarasmius palmivorus]|uniref:G protein-coupled receptor n=1 Tax=Paramarasmius palmivorus TaxID=297713 RepID=A0AAW0AUK0_9AGAR
MMIWRCYFVWGQRRKVIIVPAVLCAVNNVAAIVFVAYFHDSIGPILLNTGLLWPDWYLYTAFLSGTILTNLLLTLLIAGRIIYISREATRYVGKSHRNMYKTVVAITMESGLIYPTTLIIYIAFTVAGSELSFQPLVSPRSTTYSIFSTVAQYTLHQAAGIAPTLVIVRTSLGIAIEDTKSCITTFRAGQHDDTQVDIPQSQSTGGPVLDISRSNGPGN